MEDGFNKALRVEITKERLSVNTLLNLSRGLVVVGPISDRQDQQGRVPIGQTKI